MEDTGDDDRRGNDLGEGPDEDVDQRFDGERFDGERFDDERFDDVDEGAEDRYDDGPDDAHDERLDDGAGERLDDRADDGFDDEFEDDPGERRGLGVGQRLSELGPFLGGIAAGMVLLGIVWVVVGGLGGGDDGEQESSRTTGATRADLGGALGGDLPTVQQPAETRLDRCTAAADLLAVPLERGSTALDQWSVHVGAMNKLVVGAITLPQATAFWNQTRVGARAAIKDFERADRAVKRQGLDCPPPRLLGSRSAPEVRACSHYVGALLDELDTARTAITTWDHHVQAMDMLRMGKLSPARATQMWLSMWQRGAEEIDRFQAQDRTVRAMPGCGATAGANGSTGGATGGRDARTRMHGSGSAPASPDSSDSSDSSMGSMGSMG